MILDNEEQREILLDIIKLAPVSGSVAEVRQVLEQKISPLEEAVQEAGILKEAD